MGEQETATTHGLVVGADALAHLFGDGDVTLCGHPAVRFMHPVETVSMCPFCAAVVFRWN